MKIWVDGDACPKPIKDTLCRAAEKRQVTLTFVANQWLNLPNLSNIEMIQVADGPDIADDAIAEACLDGELVITADIPLAARCVKKGCIVLEPRGKLYNQSNIGQALNMRDFMDGLRGSGVDTGGPKSFSQKDQLQFANALDKLITKYLRHC
jgi:uncharacterized protein YaiI (UPF0178 family)|tara:strand:- start:55132 stop:55587 length:456 start_codon:yes stop_codon:yes gene_type:complete